MEFDLDIINTGKSANSQTSCGLLGAVSGWCNFGWADYRHPDVNLDDHAVSLADWTSRWPTDEMVATNSGINQIAERLTNLWLTVFLDYPSVKQRKPSAKLIQ